MAAHHVGVHRLAVGSSVPVIQISVRQQGYVGPSKLTTASTLSMMALFASSIALLDPTKPISRSTSRPVAGDTLILHPVVFCISFMDSPPVQR